MVHNLFVAALMGARAWVLVWVADSMAHMTESAVYGDYTGEAAAIHVAQAAALTTVKHVFQMVPLTGQASVFVPVAV